MKPVDISKNLLSWRTRLGLTQAEVARSLQVPLATIRNWEQGRRRPSAASVRWILTVCRTHRLASKDE